MTNVHLNGKPRSTSRNDCEFDKITCCQDPSDPKIIMNKRGMSEGIIIETTTSDLIPIDVVNIRRDKTSVGKKTRLKYINIKSNILPKMIKCDDVDLRFKITRGHGVIKIDVTKLLENFDSDYHKIKLRLFYQDSPSKSILRHIDKEILINYRARKHHKRIIDSVFS